MNTKQRYQRITSKKNNRPTEKGNNRTKKRKGIENIKTENCSTGFIIFE